MSTAIGQAGGVAAGAAVLLAGVTACGSAPPGAAPDGGKTPADSGMVEPPSCARGGNGMTNCGAAGESCCTSLEVPGGTYNRTYSNDGSGPTAEADPATVSGFRLDEYEVTVGRFRQYVDYVTGAGVAPANGSGKHTHLDGGQGLSNSATPGTFESGWDAANWDLYILTGPNAADTWNTNLACDPADHAFATWTDTPGDHENLPINCVNWFEAYAFCIWDGGFLPSEAEWEYAAAGGSQEREYPWGTASPGTSSQYAIYGCTYDGSGRCTSLANIAPVGTATAGAGLWGQLDLAGNMNEWSLDYWDNDLYVDPCIDCGYLSEAPYQGVYPYRPVRGGSFDDASSPSNLLPPARNYATGSGHDQNIGFRCARTP